MSCLKRMKNAVSLDSRSIVVPMLMIGGGGGWLTLFYFANNEYFARRHM